VQTLRQLGGTALRQQHGYRADQGGYALPMSRPWRLPSVAGMQHKPFLYDLVRAHERDLRVTADQHRLARSARLDRPFFLGRLHAAGLARLARGARRTAPATSHGPASAAGVSRPARRPCHRNGAAAPPECC
jgi:hypothetical protein